METERFELSSGTGYQPASTCVGQLISTLIRLGTSPISMSKQF